jgi:hypothetical protein
VCQELDGELDEFREILEAGIDFVDDQSLLEDAD